MLLTTSSVQDAFVRALSRSLAIIAVYSVLALARKYLPAKEETTVSDLSLEELSARFCGTEWVVGFAMVIVAMAFAWSSHWLLVDLNKSYTLYRSGEGFDLWPQTAIWWFFPCFGAAVLTWDLTLGIWRVFGDRESVVQYERWSTLVAGYDCTRLLRGMAIVIVLPIGVLTLLAISTHCTLRSQDIVECGYAFKQCKTFEYSDATRMTQIVGFRNRSGKLVARAGVVIDFKDRRRWSSANWGNFEPNVDPLLVKLLLAKTGLPLNYAEAESDIIPAH